MKAKVGVKVVYDLSATPFFLRGSGYKEGNLFSWVVSDFSLIDAIECGIVKVPRVPVADDSMVGSQPTYRELWLRIRDDLPKKGRKAGSLGGEPKLPAELQGALHSLYGNYEKYYRQWEQNAEARAAGRTPPVFIVVCNNTSVSKLAFDWIAGWQKTLADGSTVVVPGALPIFRNDENGDWTSRPNTILVDSTQLESGEAMSAEFKKAAAAEIEEFKAEYRERFPGRDVEALTNEDILREVMNTVGKLGKLGKLGENIKCVVSVSMLTEGWDANTVTHILGVRAFGTQGMFIASGLRQKFEKGGVNGVPPLGYGRYHGVPGDPKNGSLIINDQGRRTVRAIVELYLSGQQSAASIAMRLNVHLDEHGQPLHRTRLGLPLTKGSVEEVLRNRVYTGITVWQPGTPEEEIRPGSHEPIITQDEWDAIERIRARRTTRRGRRPVGRVYPLSGPARCFECSASFAGDTGGRRGKRRLRHAVSVSCVNRRSFDMEELESQMAQLLTNRFRLPRIGRWDTCAR